MAKKKPALTETSQAAPAELDEKAASAAEEPQADEAVAPAEQAPQAAKDEAQAAPLPYPRAPAVYEVLEDGFYAVNGMPVPLCAGTLCDSQHYPVPRLLEAVAAGKLLLRQVA